MVSFWPWKGEGDVASFERTLASLSEKISKASKKHDNLRSQWRRLKALWNIYSSLAYLISTVILVFVTGWRNWGPVEYTVVAGSPVIIYIINSVISAFYSYRLSSNQARLEALKKRRETAIENFKNATKYNTTHQLLEKYGGDQKEPSSTNADRPSKGEKGEAPPHPPHRSGTGFVPPPTANIQRRPGKEQQSHAHGTQPQTGIEMGPRKSGGLESPVSPQTPDFARSPHSDSTTREYSDSTLYSPHWYDRIMDLILGEDETRPINRLALICSHCKLVNGQAPPGSKSPEDIGRWRCAECREWNGQEQDTIENILDEAKRTSKEGSPLSDTVDHEV